MRALITKAERRSGMYLLLDGGHNLTCFKGNFHVDIPHVIFYFIFKRLKAM